MSIELIKIQATDGVTLDGYLNKCNEKTNKTIIQIHGMTSNCFRYRESRIQEEVKKIGFDTLCFNNRGSEVARLIKGNDNIVKLAGSAYEEISECYYDICGAIEYALKSGYNELVLQGHSLGSTKIVYTYNKLLEEKHPFVGHIKALILLSLVDLPMVVNYYGKKYINLAEEKKNNHDENFIMQAEAFPYPLSAKTFLRYAKNNSDIDFAKFGNENDNLEVLNKFKVPLFFRWGTVNEILTLEVEKQVDFIKRKIKNDYIDASFIEGANHSYYGKEKELAEEIAAFLTNIH